MFVAVYKFVSDLFRGHIEGALEHAQPEEQHGFRSGCRLEEQVVIANVFFQTTLAAGMPFLTISLHCSRGFDKVA
eukprot:6023916-Pyramimonas_sp.AAC.1